MLTSSLLSPVLLLGSLLTATTAYAETGFLTDLQLYDTYTGSNNCTDPHHWFLVQGQIFLPHNSTDTIYFNVPEAFDSFPTSEFPLSYNSKVIGAITKNDATNQFAIQPLNPNGLSNLTTTFNFLCKLSQKGLKAVTKPSTLTYIFNDNEGTTFSRSINYLAPNVSQINTNGGIFEENNTAWFTIDIPTSQFLKPIDIQSTPSTSNAYQFDIEKTTVEMVTKRDSFNQPLAAVPVTAYYDNSTNSQISIRFNTSFSGGSYIRITYYSTKLSSTSISNSLKISYPTTNLAKRDTASTDLNINTNLYAASFDNLARVNTTTPEPEVSLPSNSTYKPIFSNATLSNVTNAIPTYDVITSTQQAIVSEYGVWVPVSTISDNNVEYEALAPSTDYTNSSSANRTLTSTSFMSTPTSSIQNTTSDTSSIPVSSLSVPSEIVSSSEYPSSSAQPLYLNSTIYPTNTSSPIYQTTLSNNITTTETTCPTCSAVHDQTTISTYDTVSESTVPEIVSDFDYLEAFSTIASSSIKSNLTSLTVMTATNNITTTETTCPTCSAVHDQTTVSTFGVVSESSVSEIVSDYDYLEAVSTIPSSTIKPSATNSSIINISEDVYTSSIPAKVSEIGELQPVSTITTPHSEKSEGIYASVSESTVPASVTTIGSLEPISTMKSNGQSSVIIQESSVIASTIPAKTSLYTELQPYSSISTIATSRNTTTNGIYYYQAGGHKLSISLTSIMFAVFLILL
ncbi:Egt2p [Nakaseomyces bracarensis]|uniref:Egt2p n=1 Tax=Nakaseomyces bracarensis TaxID=273131 RepID=UPI003871438A